MHRFKKHPGTRHAKLYNSVRLFSSRRRWCLTCFATSSGKNRRCPCGGYLYNGTGKIPPMKDRKVLAPQIKMHLIREYPNAAPEGVLFLMGT